MNSPEPNTSHSFGRHVVLCGVLVVVALGLAIVFGATPLLVFPLICLVMLGGMLWMMRGGQGHGDR